MNYNDTIEQGATFYREVTLYTDISKTTPTNLTDKTPRASLMTQNGLHVANFGCAVLTALEGTIAWTMPRATTALLEPRQYLYNLDLDDADDITTDRALSGQITVKTGQVL